MKLDVGSQRWFPAATVRLVRSTLPPTMQVFRVPSAFSRYDIREYLERLYGVVPLAIRTRHYPSIKRSARSQLLSRLSDAVTRSLRVRGSAHKRATITFAEPFVPPPPQPFASASAQREGPTQSRFLDGRSATIHSYRYTKMCDDSREAYATSPYRSK